MKTRIFFILSFTLIFVYQAYSQNISKIKPVHIIWNSGNEKVTLKKASNFGIIQPDSLLLEVYFDKETINSLKSEPVTFEFKWYYYLSTKKKLMETQTIVLDETKLQEDGSYLITSKRKNLSKGWWEVQATALLDNGLLELGNITQFQIFIK